MADEVKVSEEESGQVETTEAQAQAGAEFDRAKLHPAMRDMSPEEITELFETMAGTLRTVQSRDTPDSLGVPAHARAPAPPAREPITKDKYKELLDPNSESFDPETAFKTFAEANYGQLVGDLSARTIRGLYGNFRQEFDDFKDYESDISTVLKERDPTTVTERDVLNTYLAAKGLRVTLKERQERGKKSVTTIPPSPAVQGGKSMVDLSSQEVEVAHKMFRRIKDPEQRIAEYKKFAARDEEGGMSVKVPIGGGKTE